MSNIFNRCFKKLTVPFFMLIILSGCSARFNKVGGNVIPGPGTTPTATPNFIFSFQPLNPSPSPSPSALPDILGTSLNPLGAAAQYNIPFTAENMPAGATYTMSITPTGITLNNPASTTTAPKPISSNTNILFTAPAAFGTYLLNIMAYAADGKTVILQKSYPFNVVCATPNAGFTAANLASAKITMSTPSNLSPNMATFQITGSDGVTPGVASLVVPTPASNAGYNCQLDPQGIGIVDTAPQKCELPFNSFVNYMGQRNIGVLVTDLSCNNSLVISVPTNSVPMGYQIPIVDSSGANTMRTMLGQSYNILYAELRSYSTAPIPNDPSIINVNYFNFNASPFNDLKAAYTMIKPAPVPSPSPDTLNPASLQMNSFHLYPMLSSRSFGFRVNLTGIQDNIPRIQPGDVLTAVPSYPIRVNVSNARITNVTYSTDQSGTATGLPPQTLQFNNCVLDSVFALPQPFMPGTCEGSSGGATPISLATTIEVYGTFHCLPANSACTLQAPCPGLDGVYIQNGYFDATYSVADACPAPGPPGSITIPSF